MDDGIIKTRCYLCKKKRIPIEKCKCNSIFCLECLPFFKHNCSFDWKKENKLILERLNPKIIAIKVNSI